MFQIGYDTAMARIARIVVPGCPHHVTARGNRREPIFFEDGDQDLYLNLLAEQMRKARVEVWSYGLMPNHVHLILTPSDEAGMARALGAAHKRWAHLVNAQDWPWSSVRGHLAGDDDDLVTVAPVLARVERFADLIAGEADEPGFAVLRAAELIGRPLANRDFIEGLERVLGRPVARRAPGRKPKAATEVQPSLF